MKTYELIILTIWVTIGITGCLYSLAVYLLR